MKLQALLLLGLLSLGGSAHAEGGCPAGYTPVNNGQNWTCIPGGNDAPASQPEAPPRPTGYWEKTWGAIAPSPAGGVLGTALGASSKREAERLALADCQKKRGGECEVLIAYHNQCAVMIVGDKFLGTARAETIDAASELGIRNCQSSDTNCSVYYSACTEPIFHRY